MLKESMDRLHNWHGNCMIFKSLDVFHWYKKAVAHYLVTAKVLLTGQVVSSATKVPLTRVIEIAS